MPLIVKLLLISVTVILLFALASCSIQSYESNVHEISENFTDISINASTADITFVKSGDGTCKVYCHEHKKEKHTVKVADGRLEIENVNTREWYDYIGVNFSSPKLTIALPEAQYASLNIENTTGDVTIYRGFEFKYIDLSLSTGDVNCYASCEGAVKIAVSTGDIMLEDISAGVIKLSASTGDIELSNVKVSEDVTIDVTTGEITLDGVICHNLKATGSTGDVNLDDVIATGTASVKITTGDVTFSDSDADELYITTSTGNVTGNLLSDKVFITNTKTGKIKVPASIIGGRCEITTTTGDIIITID